LVVGQGGICQALAFFLVNVKAKVVVVVYSYSRVVVTKYLFLTFGHMARKAVVVVVVVVVVAAASITTTVI
jgi:hypothetical protein